MITVQEVTVWSTDTPNHKYILSDDMRKMYGYIKSGDKYPFIFNNPQLFDSRRRKFSVLVKTKDNDDYQSWEVEGSKGNKYKIRLRDGSFSCTCPSATFRNEVCKHIRLVKDKM